MSHLSRPEAREIVARFSGASHSRRLYGTGSPMWARTLELLGEELERVFTSHQLTELSVAFLGETLAVSGVPVDGSASAVQRLMGLMRRRDVEIVSLLRDVTRGELETLLDFFATDAAELLGVRAEQWLRERGVDHVRIKHLRWSQGEGAESFRDLYRRGHRVLEREHQRARTQGTINGAVLSELARSLLEVVVHAEAPVATLLALRERDDYGWVHALNVSMLATLQAQALSLPEAEVQEIGLAGLVHDLGHNKVPVGIVGKRTRLRPEEAALLARHPFEGARMLLESHGPQSLAPVVALDHHAPWSSDALLATELVKIADVFDQLRTLCPFEDARGARSALGYMLLRLRGRFSPFLLERFAALFGGLEPDEVVFLTSGETARVVKPHPELALHPTVEVIQTAEGLATTGTVYELWRWTDSSDVAVIPELVGPLRGLDPAELEALG